jgi:hypothetical protein
MAMNRTFGFLAAGLSSAMVVGAKVVTKATESVVISVFKSFSF